MLHKRVYSRFNNSDYSLQLAFDNNFVDGISHVLDVLRVETSHTDATVLHQVDVELFD